MRTIRRAEHQQRPGQSERWVFGHLHPGDGEVSRLVLKKLDDETPRVLHPHVPVRKYSPPLRKQFHDVTAAPLRRTHDVKVVRFPDGIHQDPVTIRTIGPVLHLATSDLQVEEVGVGVFGFDEPRLLGAVHRGDVEGLVGGFDAAAAATVVPDRYLAARALEPSALPWVQTAALALREELVRGVEIVVVVVLADVHLRHEELDDDLPRRVQQHHQRLRDVAADAVPRDLHALPGVLEDLHVRQPQLDVPVETSPALVFPVQVRDAVFVPEADLQEGDFQSLFVGRFELVRAVQLNLAAPPVQERYPRRVHLTGRRDEHPVARIHRRLSPFLE